MRAFEFLLESKNNKLLSMFKNLLSRVSDPSVLSKVEDQLKGDEDTQDTDQPVSINTEEPVKEDLSRPSVKQLLAMASEADEEAILEAMATLAKPSIKATVSKILEGKGFIDSEAIANTFTNYLVASRIGVDDILAFLDAILLKGIIDTKKLTTPGYGSIDDLVTISNNPVYQRIKPNLLTYEPVEGGVAIGKGEAFLSLLGQNVKKGTEGDLNVNGKEVEVKGKGSRPSGQKGFKSPAATLDSFRDDLAKINPLAAEASANQLGLTNKGITNINKLLLSGYARNPGNEAARTKSLFSDFLNDLFPSIDQKLIGDFLIKVVNEDGSLDPAAFRKYYFLMNVAYYKAMENFDGLFIFDSEKEKYFYFEDLEDLEKAYDQGIIQTEQKFSYETAPRGGVYRFRIY